MMQFHSLLLDNGLQIIGETNPSARSLALAFFVRTGSRDETPEVSGVTHFLEHMIFKGTERRTALEVNRDFDRIGADYNAFTSEENTVFHAVLLPEYLPQAIDILADILRPSLREEDFEMEKKVIIEEIGMYEDQPGWAAYDHAKQLYFGSHLLGNSILGTPESIRALKRDQMYEYFERRYVAPNITVVAAGAFVWEDLVQLVRKHCGNWRAGPIGRGGVEETRGTGKFQVLHRANVAQEHVILIGPGPTAASPLRHAADTLSLAIGDDSGSRLYWSLVDPGLVESAGCGFHEYEGTGAFYTSFSCDPEQVEENLVVIHEELQKVQEENITEQELNQAKSKILSALVRRSERPAGRMNDIGMAWIYQHQYRSVDDDLNAFEAVTLDHLRQVMEQYPLLQLTTLALGPLEEVQAPGMSRR